MIFFFVFTLTVVGQCWYAFREKQTRHLWHSRINSVFYKHFQPDTSEAAYQRFRFWNRAAAVIIAFVWSYVALWWVLLTLRA